MSDRLIKIFFLFCICSHPFAQTSFNTARYKMPTEDKYVVVKEDKKEPQKEEKKPQKESWFKRLFKRKKQPDLKKEIDSLKTLIIQKDKEHKQAIKEIEKSFGQVVKNEVSKVAETKRVKENKVYSKVYTPLRMMVVTSSFGNRMHPIDNEIKMHYGIDLKANYDQVYSIMDGIVKETGFDKNGGGKYVKIAHSDRFETLYMHLSEIYYQKGDKVKAGFIVAKSGNTGKSTNPHLHFAVKDSGKFINPMTFLKQLIEINNVININKYGTK